MKEQTVTFFGHRDTPKETEPALRLTLIDLIENKNATVFYVGNHGNFDAMVRHQLEDLSKTYAEDVSEIVFANERFANFWGSLSDDDKTILMYAMNGMTQAEIAEKMGFKTHSAVGKRLTKLKKKFVEA